MFEFYSKMMVCTIQPVGYMTSGGALDQRVIPIQSTGTSNDNEKHAEYELEIPKNQHASITAEYKHVIEERPSIYDVKGLLAYADAALALTAFGYDHRDTSFDTYKFITVRSGITERERAKTDTGLVLLNGLRDIKKSEAKLMLAMNNNHYDPRLWLAMGCVHVERKKWEDAENAFSTALNLSKPYVGLAELIQNKWSLSRLCRGEVGKALSELTRAKINHPDIIVFEESYEIALILANKKNVMNERGMPSKQAYLLSKAGIYAATYKDFAHAMSLYEKAIQYNPNPKSRAGENLMMLYEMCM